MASIDASTEDRPLRRGWTTGTCAAAATKAACTALLTGRFPDPVEVTLPSGQTTAFALATWSLDSHGATAGIVKDAGDDPDVTHGALVKSTVKRGKPGAGVVFRGGSGVGQVTRPGLPIPPGEPAINPVPRAMIRKALAEAAGGDEDFVVEISVPDGETMAEKTLNGRLGIIGGISILGTTGIVVPYSCAAWIASIHRGIDVARAMGIDHVAGATGDASERAVQKFHGLSEQALIDMGDFVGGMLKYIRAHPVPRVTVAGGVAKMTKLAQGMLDVHSKRGAPDLEALGELAREAGGPDRLVAAIRGANTVAEAFKHAAGDRIALGDIVARRAWPVAASVLDKPGIELEILIFEREGELMGHAPFRPTLGADHDASRPLKRR